MASLAIFDFDRTVVDGDSDATIISRLREKKPPPEWEGGNHDWTPYMSNVFEHAYSAGLSQDDILDSIASMRPTPGMLELITTLAAEGWDIIILSDANTVFVKHWLKMNGVQDCVKAVLTNRAFWQNGRLYIEPYMNQSVCPRCPVNLCKTLALETWLVDTQVQYKNMIYCGDGRNDYCPAMSLDVEAKVFPRRGYPLDDLTKKTLLTESPQIKAKVVPWDDCQTIIQEIFPTETSIKCEKLCEKSDSAVKTHEY